MPYGFCQDTQVPVLDILRYAARMTFRLAHISDIHLGPLPRASARQLMSKRVTGYINWHRNRAKSRGGDVLAGLIDALNAAAPDHIAVTGDLMNIGLPEEIENTGLWLEALGDPKHVSVVPGNHDAYVRDVLEKALVRWAPYLTDDAGLVPAGNSDFPYLRRRGPVALIGVNSAIVTTPFVAAGRVGAAQCERLSEILATTGEEGMFRIIMIHHPPVRGAAKPQKRLYGIGLFQQTVKMAGAELVLHGHTHLPQRHAIDGSDGAKVPVIGVPSASEGLDGHKPASAFNMFEIDGDATSGWQCTLTQHSLTRITAPYEPQQPEMLITRSNR